MKDDEEGCLARGETAHCEAGDSAALLHAEISFWRDLLNDCDGSLAPESIERMRQALALAEYRLLQLCGMRRTETASSDGPTRTSPLQEVFLH
jgi:hypothetical protein